MKLLNAKKIVIASCAAVLAASAALLFSSCQDVIYANIRKEVSLKSATVKSDIRSIIRYKTDFYCVNGNIYRKSNGANYYGAWQRSSAPSGQVLKLAADSTNIYALVGISKEDLTEGENVPVRRELWYSNDGSSWNKVTGVYGSGTILYNNSAKIETYLFCTNAIASANRKAYFIVRGGAAGYKAYELTGATASEMELLTVNAETKPICNASNVSRSCVWDVNENKARFFTSTGSCTNETTTGYDGSKKIYYYGDGGTLKWGEMGSSTVKGSVGAYASVYSIGYTSDYLLVGTTSGLTHHPLTPNGPGSSSRQFKTNADATLSTQYTILAILVVNPEKTELSTAIYASQNYTGSGSNSAQFDHICMWAYYPERGEWNRD